MSAQARAGSLTLDNAILAVLANTSITWPAAATKHDHSRTCQHARKRGSISILSTIRRPSERIESGFRRRLDAEKLGAFAASLRHNKDFLEHFPTSDHLVNALKDSANALHMQALHVAQHNSDQSWGNPVASYLDDDDPRMRVTWLCLSRFSEHWHAATGLAFSVSNLTLDPVDHNGWHRSMAHHAATLSEENVAFINFQLYKGDYALYHDACNNPQYARPLVTDGRGKVLGTLAQDVRFAAPAPTN